MALALIKNSDLDTLPYRVWSETNEPVAVRFALPTESDREKLSVYPWNLAVYGPAWPDFIGDSKTRKLISTDGDSPEILGMLRIGEALPGHYYLLRNLLEANPEYKYPKNLSSRRIRGIGRVLVARLVAESYNRGMEGRVQVRSHPGAVSFYKHLGFQENRLPFVYDLMKEEAEALFDLSIEAERGK